MKHRHTGRGWTVLFLAASLVTLNWMSGTLTGYSAEDLPALWQQWRQSAVMSDPSAVSAVETPKEGGQLPAAEGNRVEAVSAPKPPIMELSAAPVGSLYDFSQPAPQSAPVERSYFKDAAFVGDSRTDGFLIYSGIGGGKNLTSNGLSIFQLDEKKVLTIGGEKYTLLEALAREEYGKVYLSLGINELGVNDDEGFFRSYCEAIDTIRAIQPNAVIYIQGLIPLNEGVIAKTIKRDYLTNEHLRIYNELMRRAAEEKKVVFLDLYSAFVDENEELPADASHDGVHLSRDYCKKWLEYLLVHTVDYDALYPGGVPAAARAENNEEAERHEEISEPAAVGAEPVSADLLR